MSDIVPTAQNNVSPDDALREYLNSPNIDEEARQNIAKDRERIWRQGKDALLIIHREAVLPFGERQPISIPYLPCDIERTGELDSPAGYYVYPHSHYLHK